MLTGTGLLPSGEGQDTQISSSECSFFILSEPEYWVPPPSAVVTSTAHLCSICLQNFNTKVVQSLRRPSECTDLST